MERDQKDTGAVTVKQLKNLQINPNHSQRKGPVPPSNLSERPMHINYNKGLDFQAFSGRLDRFLYPMPGWVTHTGNTCTMCYIHNTNQQYTPLYQNQMTRQRPYAYNSRPYNHRQHPH